MGSYRIHRSLVSAWRQTLYTESDRQGLVGSLWAGCVVVLSFCLKTPPVDAQLSRFENELEDICSSLYVWGSQLGAAQGDLDRILQDRSDDLMEVTLSLLVHLGESLTKGLLTFVMPPDEASDVLDVFNMPRLLQMAKEELTEWEPEPFRPFTTAQEVIDDLAQCLNSLRVDIDSSLTEVPAKPTRRRLSILKDGEDVQRYIRNLTSSESTQHVGALVEHLTKADWQHQKSPEGFVDGPLDGDGASQSNGHRISSATQTAQGTPNFQDSVVPNTPVERSAPPPIQTSGNPLADGSAPSSAGPPSDSSTALGKRKRAPTKKVPMARIEPHIEPAPSTSPTQRALKSPSTLRPVRRLFRCPLAMYSCQSTFSSKNEWKRHVSTQHIRLGFWRCDLCPPTLDSTSTEAFYNDFNRKDLFTQHLRRMHKAPVNKSGSANMNGTPLTVNDRNAPTPIGGMPEYPVTEDNLPEHQERCYRRLRDPPPKSSCLFCERTFAGNGSWDERMEHVGRHIEKELKGKTTETLDVSEWREDLDLRDWLVREKMIERDGNGEWKLGEGGSLNGRGYAEPTKLDGSGPLPADDRRQSLPQLQPTKPAPLPQQLATSPQQQHAPPHHQPSPQYQATGPNGVGSVSHPVNPTNDGYHHQPYAPYPHQSPHPICQLQQGYPLPSAQHTYPPPPSMHMGGMGVQSPYPPPPQTQQPAMGSYGGR